LFIKIWFIPGYHRFTDGKAADILQWPWNVQICILGKLS